MKASRRSPYDRGPWKAHEGPGMIVGTAILAGGIYGLARVFTRIVHARPRPEVTAGTRPQARAERGARFS